MCVLSQSIKKTLVAAVVVGVTTIEPTSAFVNQAGSLRTASVGSSRTRGVMYCQQSKTDKLREMLKQDEIIIMPCCYDGLTARLIEMHGFPLAFMTGFGVSAVRGKLLAPERVSD